MLLPLPTAGGGHVEHVPADRVDRVAVSGPARHPGPPPPRMPRGRETGMEGDGGGGESGGGERETEGERVRDGGREGGREGEGV